MNEEQRAALALVIEAAKGKDEAVSTEVKGALKEFATPAKLTHDDYKKYGEETDAGKEYLETVRKDAKSSGVDEFLESTVYKSTIQAKEEAAVLDFELKAKKAKTAPTAEERLEIAKAEKMVALEAKVAASDKRVLQKELKLDTIEYMTEKGLGKDFLEFALTDADENLDVVLAKVDKLNNLLSKKIDAGVEKQFGDEGGRSPGVNNKSGVDKMTANKVEELRVRASQTHKEFDKIRYVQAKQALARLRK